MCRDSCALRKNGVTRCVYIYIYVCACMMRRLMTVPLSQRCPGERAPQVPQVKFEAASLIRYAVCGSSWNVDTNHLKEIDSQIVFVLHVFSGSSLVAISVACHHGEMSQD